MTRQEAEADSTVHYLVKDVLQMTANKDVLDRYNDIKLVLDILKAELDQNLQSCPHCGAAVIANIANLATCVCGARYDNGQWDFRGCDFPT